MTEHEERADLWEREPQRFAEEFRHWFEWIRSKESGSNEWGYGYRLNVHRSEAASLLRDLQLFSDAVREFMAGRTEPPSVSVELFTGYLSDLRRASEFNEAVPEMYSTERLDELNRRLPETKLPEIETANSIIRKWANRVSGKVPERLHTEPTVGAGMLQSAGLEPKSKAEKELKFLYVDSGSSGVVESGKASAILSNRENAAFRVLVKSYPAEVTVKNLAGKLRDECDSDPPTVIRNLKLRLENVGLTIKTAPYLIERKNSEMSPDDIGDCIR